MRIEKALKKIWKNIESVQIGQSSTVTATKPSAAKSADSFSAAAATSSKHFTQVQEPLRGAAPKFDNATANKIVESLYQGALGRGLDDSGRSSWVPMVEQGRLAEVIENVVGSPEFAERASKMDPKQLSSELYSGILKRGADPEGDAGTQAAISRGHLAHRVFDMLLSPEHKEVMTKKPEVIATPTPKPTPTPTTPTVPSPTLPKEPGQALSTIPMRPEYAQIPVDTSSEAAAAKSAAKWVRENKPEYFNKGDDRQAAYEAMTWVIGALRAHGIDAHRVVNHPSHAMGVGVRYGADAVVMPSRAIFDVYVAFGDPGRSDPTAQNVGQYADGRLRE